MVTGRTGRTFAEAMRDRRWTPAVSVYHEQRGVYVRKNIRRLTDAELLALTERIANEWQRRGTL